MPRIRSVKPEYFTHPKVQACSIPARLMFVALWTEADDEGRLHDQPRRLAAVAFGEIDVPNGDTLLQELANHDLLERYEKRGWSLIQIHDWRDHQRISHPAPSKLPAPGRRTRWKDSTHPPEDLRSLSAPHPEALHADSTPDLGKERKGTGSREQGTKTVAVRPHVRDEAWEAFTESCGIEPAELSKQRRDQLNGMLRSLKNRSGMRGLSSAEQGAEIRRRAANHWTVPTPEYLVGHWAELGEQRPVKSTRVAPADRMLAEVREELEHAAQRSEGPADDARRSLPSA